MKPERKRNGCLLAAEAQVKPFSRKCFIGRPEFVFAPNVVAIRAEVESAVVDQAEAIDIAIVAALQPGLALIFIPSAKDLRGSLRDSWSKQIGYKASFSMRAEDLSARVSVECAAVARHALCQFGPCMSVDPQLTIRR